MENSPKHLENNIYFDIFTLNIIEKQSQEIQELTRQVDWFKQQFKLASQREFGKSSERSSSNNLSLFDEKLDQPNHDTEHANTGTETVTYTRKKKKIIGRHFDVSRFPKEQRIHDLPEKDKTCGCGEALEKVSEDVSIQVDHIPETFKVIEHITLK